ncbi:MAG: CRISPR-associated endoribonuclease Cas6 [Sphingobacteriales bacterium 41-5]|nr:MAG: CRISPR-associated endoribonuclease Cas6 [Niabella sp. SCN 42-15]OJU25785.1 MAG: CRISPR-associated endoribonuclease Cas6 [Sphingobacteriales bacterium 41-5]
MRLYICLSRNNELIPFNYQHLLTGVIHKWIGNNNNEHGKKSLYSFSWLKNTETSRMGINLSQDSYFFFSSYDEELVKKVARGILADPSTFCGSRVIDVQIKSTPIFSRNEKFILDSPILIKKREGDRVKHVTFNDEDFNFLLTENLKTKLGLAGLSSENIRVKLDEEYTFPTTKLVDYKGVKNKTTLAPVLINGSPEQIAFAWEVGLGHSTGIGFGALK